MVLWHKTLLSQWHEFGGGVMSLSDQWQGLENLFEKCLQFHKRQKIQLQIYIQLSKSLAEAQFFEFAFIIH